MPKRFVHPTFFGPWCLVLLMSLISGANTPALAQSQLQSILEAKANLAFGQETTSSGISPDLSKKNVLLLHAYTYEAASSVVMDPIFLKGFTDAGFDTNNLHFEFMDLVKHPELAHRMEFIKYLGRKYEKIPIDLIIALHRTGFRFLVEEGKDLFPGIPVINVIADPEFIENEDFRTAQLNLMHRLKRPFVILPFSFGTDLTVKSILSLQPDTRALVVISGSDQLDRQMEQSARRSLEAWQGRLQIEYFSGLPLERVLQRVAILSPKTAILFTIFSADPKRTYRNPDVLQRISKAANAPVFGLYDTLLRKGIVGGVMTDHGHEAARSVGFALEILRGRPPTERITINPAPLVPTFDWEQLRRWGLNEDRLSPGSVVLNRPKTIWSEYKGLVIVGIGVFLAQTFLVIGLLVQRSLKRKAELSVRQKTEELDQFFNVSLDLLCIANTDGYFLRLNPVWERILGYSREELMGKRFFDFVHPDDLLRTQGAVSAQASGQRVSEFENRYRCKDGTYRWLEWSSVPAGNLIYAAARDITERKRAEAEIARARTELLRVERSSRLSELTASLAHELNQPLAAILSNAQAALRFLKSDKPDLNEFQQILQDIISDDQRAGNVIRSLRSMMKREEGEKRPTNLNDVLNDVIQIFRSEAIFRNVRIETELDGSLPPVLGDKGQLQQVVLNIIMNGSEAMSGTSPEQRKLILRTQRKDHRIGVSVRDFGPGIDKENLERVFQPFFTTKGTGLGMGLAVCHTIVEAHGGRIWAENNSDGGTTFFIELPVISRQ